MQKIHDSMRYACEVCRDSGCFPGSSFASWASCICEAGRLRCTQGSDCVSERPVEAEDDAIVTALNDLESQTGIRARLHRSAAPFTEDAFRHRGKKKVKGDLRAAPRAVRGHAATGRGQPKS